MKGELWIEKEKLELAENADVKEALNVANWKSLLPIQLTYRTKKARTMANHTMVNNLT
jgi:hypothetical protein